MTRHLFTLTLGALLFFSARGYGQDVQSLIGAGNEALSQNKLHEAAEAFQKALDINPSSVRAHEGLGVALSRAIVAGTVRPSAGSEVIERAESNLNQAIDLSPSSAKPLAELSDLEAFLAAGAADPDEKSDRYKQAQDLMKRVVALDPGKADVYLRLASLERDQFGPVIQQAAARFSSNKGPLPDTDLRHKLQQQYGSLIDDAIANAEKASQLNGNSPRPLLLTSRLFRERAVIRDTPEQYSADMHSANDWQIQFQAVGGHLDRGDK
jgi:tetratricopeptide (TPR) repeat protein